MLPIQSSTRSIELLYCTAVKRRSDRYCAAAIGGMACLYWVPLAFRSLAMGTYGLSYGECAHCPLAAGQASALAGWPRACIQSISEFWIMHA